MIDTTVEINATFCKRSIMAHKLTALLTDHLNHGDMLVPNHVGNLTIMRNGKYIGYVDIGLEKVEFVKDCPSPV
jgi:hypothetical protein